MFDNIIQSLEDKYRPKLREVGAHFDNHLGDIRNAILDVHYLIGVVSRRDSHIENFPRYTLSLESDTETELANIPATETWVLENVSVLNACAVNINESGVFRFAQQYDAAGITSLARPVPFNGGSNLTITATTADDSDSRVYLQFRRCLKDTGRPVRWTGTMNPTPDGDEPQQQVNREMRHGVR